jgi:hypothetical protein
MAEAAVDGTVAVAVDGMAEVAAAEQVADRRAPRLTEREVAVEGGVAVGEVGAQCPVRAEDRRQIQHQRPHHRNDEDRIRECNPPANRPKHHEKYK